MRLHEFETELFDKKKQDMGMEDAQNIIAKVTLDLDSIVGYREAYLQEDEDLETLGQAVIVYFPDGNDFFLRTSYDEFTKLLKK